MDIAVISDLHLSAGDGIDQFNHDHLKFIKFLKYLEDNFEKIYLLGDIYETLMSKFLWQNKESLYKCMQYNKDIVSRFLNPQYKYIHGNHDLIAGKVSNTPDEDNINIDGIQIHLSHGHKSDIYECARWISEIGIWLGSCMLRMNYSQIYNFIYELELKSSFSMSQGKIISRGAEELAKIKNADIVIQGHTHIGSVAELDKKIFMNSGTCAGGNFSYLTLDTKRNDYKYHDRW